MIIIYLYQGLYSFINSGPHHFALPESVFAYEQPPNRFRASVRPRAQVRIRVDWAALVRVEGHSGQSRGATLVRV